MMDSCVYHFNVAAGSDGWITCLFVKVSNITRNEFQIVSTLQETLHWTFEVSDCPGMDRVLGPGPPHHCKHCIILNTITVLTERAEVLEWLDLCSSFPAYWRSNRFHTHTFIHSWQRTPCKQLIGHQENIWGSVSWSRTLQHAAGVVRDSNQQPFNYWMTRLLWGKLWSCLSVMLSCYAGFKLCVGGVLTLGWECPYIGVGVS